jgi:hypothetical protein
MTSKDTIFVDEVQQSLYFIRARPTQAYNYSGLIQHIIEMHLGQHPNFQAHNAGTHVLDHSYCPRSTKSATILFSPSHKPMLSLLSKAFDIVPLQELVSFCRLLTFLSLSSTTFSI